MLPADPAARAGSTPEASGDSSSGTFGKDMSSPNQTRFVFGSPVRIKERTELEEFFRTHEWDESMIPHQLCHAGERGMVDLIERSDSGHPLYGLERVPGIWHEDCLVED